jgi:hypothetical protein
VAACRRRTHLTRQPEDRCAALKIKRAGPGRVPSHPAHLFAQTACCADRTGSSVLTIDRRHFVKIRHKPNRGYTQQRIGTVAEKAIFNIVRPNNSKILSSDFLTDETFNAYQHNYDHIK